MKLFAYLFSLVFIALACKEQKTYTSPAGYDFRKPYIINLPREIDEISGLTYYSKDKSVFAINDENGILYKITPGKQTQIHHWQFARDGDFEELVLHDSTFYILRSDGKMFIVKFKDSVTIGTDIVDFPYGNKNEFEALYFDSSLNRLVMICKDCEDEKKRALSTFGFDMSTRTFSESPLGISTKEMAIDLGVRKFKFKASAAAVSPVDHNLYVLSSIYKLLIVVDSSRQIRQFYSLNPGLFKQAEGLTFSDDGSMIISNEASDVGTANLLIFNYSKPKQQ